MTPPAAVEGSGGRLRVAVQAAAIAAAAAWVFQPALHGGWLWDDGLEIARNPLLRDPAGWWKAWIGPAGLDYFPLKTMLQWAQWQLWGGHLAGYHASNIVLHIASAWLLWRLLARLGVRTAWLGGMLFAVHPLAVESVAWISEFKNVVSLPLLLLSFGAFLDWDAVRSRRAYLLSLLWFAAAMLCKTTVAMLPAVLILFAWWRRGRVGRADWIATAPFIAISAVLGLVTLKFQWSRAMGLAGAPAVWGGAWRQAGWSLLDDLRSCVIPVGLAPVYGPIQTALPALLPWIAIAAGLALFWCARKGWGRHALLVSGWMLLNLLPVIGLIPMAYLRVSPRADHLVYLSLAGAAGGAAAAFGALWERAIGAKPALRIVLAGVASVCLAFLASASRAYAGAFAGEPSLWSLAVARQPDAWLARSNWGRVLLEEGRPEAALAQLRIAARLEPASAEVRANLGEALDRCGQPAEALAQYRMAARVEPEFAGGRYDLGCALLRAGRTAEAEGELRAAVRLAPGYAAAHNNLGLALARLGRLQEAVAEYRAALRLDPRLPEACLNLGNAWFRLGRPKHAIAEYRAALRRDPNYAAAHRNLGVALQSMGWTAAARSEFQAAAALGAR